MYYSLDFLRKVKAGLEQIRNPAARMNCTGICSTLGDRMEYEYPKERNNWLKGKFITWDEFSGDEDYPVKSECIMSPASKYDTCFDMWNNDTTYGRARLRLLEYLIEQVDADIKEAEVQRW
jgi:hypothetical protein